MDFRCLNASSTKWRASPDSDSVFALACPPATTTPSNMIDGIARIVASTSTPPSSVPSTGAITLACAPSAASASLTALMLAASAPFAARIATLRVFTEGRALATIESAGDAFTDDLPSSSALALFFGTGKPRFAATREASSSSIFARMPS